MRLIRRAPCGSWRTTTAGSTTADRNLPTGVRSSRAHEASVYTLAFGWRGELLASGDRLGRVKIWDTNRWEELAELDAYPEPIFELEFASNGTVLAVSGVGQEVKFWNFDEVFERVARNLVYQRRRHDPTRRSTMAGTGQGWIDLAFQR